MFYSPQTMDSFKDSYALAEIWLDMRYNTYVLIFV
jgi:hypothetical protein